MFQLTRAPIELAPLLSVVQRDSDGAITSFLGVVRNHARGRRVIRMEYHAYEPMAAALIEQVGRELEDRWSVKAAIVHRLGCLEIGEASVAIVVASPHRAEAFAACRHAIERIKAEAPIWKKEFYEDGSTWVEQEPGGSHSMPGG
ncbi:MAG TPA: molybdenum cofactor biosynthesis protein MoaE [Armatimonadota bacterium]|nr:molybdenum cofactor biosynthesis protein MoaE [Armatimonadota bacterium]